MAQRGIKEAAGEETRNHSHAFLFEHDGKRNCCVFEVSAEYGTLPQR